MTVDEVTGADRARARVVAADIAEGNPWLAKVAEAAYLLVVESLLRDGDWHKTVPWLADMVMFGRAPGRRRVCRDGCICRVDGGDDRRHGRPDPARRFRGRRDADGTDRAPDGARRLDLTALAASNRLQRR